MYKNGIVLVLVSGLLTLVLMLAVSLVFITRLERTRTGTDLDRVRAKMLARSGVEYAVARLLQPKGSLSILEERGPAEDWRYRDEPEIPLEESLNPSFNQDPYTDLNLDGRYSTGVPSDPYDDPDRNGRYDGWSGRLRGVYGLYSDRFRLRIEDTGSKISVNGNGSGLQGEPLTLDRNGNGRWDPGEPLTDRPVRIENPDGSFRWKSYHRSKDLPSGEYIYVTGHVEEPNGKWDAGDGVIDRNGNNKRDFIYYRDENGNGQYDKGETVHGSYADYWYLQFDAFAERYDTDTYEWNSNRYHREDFIDTIPNGVWDPPEPFSDLNENGMWDGPDEYEDRNANGIWDGPQAGLRHFLDALGTIVGTGPELGKRILEGGTYDDYLQVRNRIGESDYRKILPYVTLYGKTDPTVIAPPTPRLREGDRPRSQAELNRLWPIAAEPRVPVNVNTASLEVLRALFQPLEALHFERGCDFETVSEYGTGYLHVLGTMKKSTMRENAVLNLATSIIGAREALGPFRSWRQWEGFTQLLSIKTEGQSEQGLYNWLAPGRVLLPEEAALVNANCNSNSRLNKFNPDQLIDRLIDKTDLIAYTTELCFHPSGLFSIRSDGRVETQREIRGRHGIDTLLSLFETWNETTQSDFSTGAPSENTNPAAYPTTRNQTIETYPQPSSQGAADWDGYLMLATNRMIRLSGEETPEERSSGLEISMDPTLLFYARYDETIDGNYSGGGGDLECRPETVDWHPAWSGSSGRPNGNAVIDPENPGSLFADGIYSDFRNVPAYDMVSKNGGYNFQSEAGVVSFWTKFNGRAVGNGPSPYHWAVSFTHHPVTADNTSRRLMLGWGITAEGAGNVSMISEPSGGDDSESVKRISDGFPKGTWQHVGMAWDITQEPSKHATSVHRNDEVSNTYSQYSGNRVPSDFDFSSDDGFNRRRFRLGEISRPIDDVDSRREANNLPPCATIDEFCLYGRQEGNHVEGAEKIWRDQYLQGRFYNLGDATFTSRGRFLPGAKILTLSWTSRLPQDVPDKDKMDAMWWINEYIFGDIYDPLYAEAQGREYEEKPPEIDFGLYLDFFDGSSWLLDLDGNGHLSEEEKQRVDDRGWNDEGGIPIDRFGKGHIRYRVYFLENADHLNRPLTVSPVLDAVSIRYVPPEGFSVLEYRE